MVHRSTSDSDYSCPQASTGHCVVELSGVSGTFYPSAYGWILSSRTLTLLEAPTFVLVAGQAVVQVCPTSGAVPAGCPASAVVVVHHNAGNSPSDVDLTYVSGTFHPNYGDGSGGEMTIDGHVVVLRFVAA